MRHVIGAMLAVSLTTGAAHAELAEFKDWVVGCDNLRACTALGLTAKDDGRIAYLKITRDGAADAGPQAEVVAWTEDDTSALFFTVDGERERLTAKANDGYARAPLGEAVLAKLANAGSLRVATVDAGGNRINDPVDISADGASAALRYMDAAQKREDGVTALVARGDKPASDIPPVPAVPQLVALKITALDPIPAVLPSGLQEPGEFCSEAMRYVAFALSDTSSLWGVCLDAAAYNFTYAYYSVENGKAEPLKFRVPGTENQPGDLDGELVNAWLAEDGRSLHSGALGRGVGDCGESAEWVWDGAAMQPAGYKALWTCRGVHPDDWPVLYRATKESP